MSSAALHRPLIAALGARALADLFGQAQILHDRAPGQQRRILEDETDVPTAPRDRRRFAEDLDHARGRIEQVGDNPQQR